MDTELVRQKRKYFDKTLSLNAMILGYDRVLDTEDYFSEWAWKMMLPFIWLDISGLFIFGLSPTELEPLNLDFTIELPTTEEWLQGIKLKFERIDLGELWKQFNWEYFLEVVPPVLDFETFVKENILPQYQSDVAKMQYRKLIVGYTKYGEGYVDPPLIREFLRATFYEIYKRRPDYTRLKEIFMEVAQKLGIAEHIAEAVYNRIIMLSEVLFENFILGYNILGISKLSKRGKSSAQFTTLTWRGEVFDVEYSKLAEPNAAFILGVTPLGFGLLIPRERFFKPTIKGLTPKIAWFIDYKGRRLIRRYRATHIGFANYQRTEEMMHYAKSERADQYHALRSFFAYIDDLIREYLANKNVDKFKANMYRRAVAMLIGHRKKRHKWGFGAYKTMTEDEFKEFWIGYWVRQGLDSNILNELYNLVKPWLAHLRGHAEELGRRLKEKRKRLAQWLE